LEKPPFHLRIKMGDAEVELSGDKNEVLDTLKNIDKIVTRLNKAFNGEKQKRAGKQVKAPVAREDVSPHDFPKIVRTTQCGEAVQALLASDWGKTPRKIGEIREAMEANAIFFPKTTLSGVLVWLVKKGQLRRWKDKKRGYLYVINEMEVE